MEPFMPTTITICDTCKRDDWAAGEGAETDGEALAALVEAAARGIEGVVTRRHSCLMGCSGACNVALQAPGKVAYTLGRFEPTDAAAAGLVDYARRHDASETGVVPYRDWPTTIKGHFVTRHPPLDG
jgi:predicted metal-binding protein